MDAQWWRLLTCLFLHFGVFHIGVNMWILWNVGRLVERLFGTVGFALLYFLSGLLASIASLLFNPSVVSAGASGAVFGVFGGLSGFVLLRRDAVPRAMLVRLCSSVFVLLGLNIIFGLMMTGIDTAAHMGGLVSGVLFGLVLSGPLPGRTAAGRRVRNLATLLLGMAVLLGAVCLSPEAPPDTAEELKRVAETEREILGRYTALIDPANDGDLGRLRLADSIADEVLPPWSEARKQVTALLDAPTVDRAALTEYANYLRLREESWQLLIQGIRESDRAKLDRHHEKWLEADRIARQLSSE
jgi:hypothetical protein